MESRGKTVALLVAAGSGSRTGGEVPKQYRRIAGKAVLAHAIDHLRHPAIDAIQVVIGADQEAAYVEAIGAHALPPPVIGGATRQQSVRRGLEALAGHGFDHVLIHDAARPFLPAGVIDRLQKALDMDQAAVPALPVVDTLARTDGRLGDTIARDGLVRVQTPQAFRFAAILKAHSAWNGGEATDDAQVARAAGIGVAMVEGAAELEKLTYEADLARAEARLAAALTSRTGLGFDVHPLASGEELWLGGLRIPHDKGLKGHSDADVVLHALTDALLGALGAGDIGDHFPPSDPQWRGAPSSLFVEHARSLAESARGRIEHVDLTIICEAPKIGPHRAAMREKIAGLLRLPIQRVSIKATTTERLGFTGRGEGIAAQAVATIRLPEDS
ncbi:bifunctional 2-C-methyl-D-erythritol 4-phosphate cytidylyltransferase/2-C-methyl-D-erythritol 2,4-cyclodiphosphate synthase [Sphingosinicella sp. LHD-64]|uniref:bifunctional 2-C-methyl-D-erythritol 4-phosphate cytidylyltransferase/2-C-methyl-D-erythritol 2,4-cyclodiphosphate synthase n=1 Tax=Sphingosinicella sp. LHD-64 TaxID=3072139 RepID=UPI00280D01A4|nr:bifunctional 2-C-methyl-D-erythritol 4-phosphate cytidylyltransferase/2-C-methyl-D-erythritol 2,4-cyclodiphosphate synthase [Sphingosinicella sp. LHD-64]MDQ8754787.1 bifunctional 2-C-methyl-D-erythritol 4-phosphate cytidylyltransferase/2-C-methyl-D-erythritol 2,4-cyclodiphosphate synthase [Sphingosinicella sp. LHD-64]